VQYTTNEQKHVLLLLLRAGRGTHTDLLEGSAAGWGPQAEAGSAGPCRVLPACGDASAADLQLVQVGSITGSDPDTRCHVVLHAGV
jgi:hypothetical protein